MVNIPKRVKDRLLAGIKRFQPVLVSAKTRDINESDTVIIVTDMLADIFGFKKYSEITSEYAIRGTFVDLAIKIDGTLHLLIEVKSINLPLKDLFTKQAVDYGVNQGVEWVVLTNGILWQIYKISYGKPINQELVLEIDFLNLNPKNFEDIKGLYVFTKEGIEKSMLGNYYAQQVALSRFFISATILSEPVLDVIRKILRKLSPDVKINKEQIREVLLQEVLKREVIEGGKVEEACRKIGKVSNQTAKKNTKENQSNNETNESKCPPSITP